MSGDTAYCYPPDYKVLKNKLGLRDEHALERFERRSVVQRAGEGIPDGDFDLNHLRTIHRHLFQDVYDWAGTLRTVEISKGGNQFQFLRYIRTGMADVHRRVVAKTYLKGLTPRVFAESAGEIIGDVNYVHPFREGNGRTLALYLEQLASNAGHPIDLRLIRKDHWIEASKAAHAGNHAVFGACIQNAIRSEQKA
ncbi:cell division protein [Bosea caraganae]|uniref:protein adenylyltransferase n=1 Tax=Bosea caraganae TaxID=2763117 RepID=A0A370L9K5_9HYPH|nr:Fic family protein [Bosea caraganae]RDJ26662.1 cell division protein [Bosea caraganae]RDJ30549.1 cell division protein [Bosea caraganae]